MSKEEIEFSNDNLNIIFDTTFNYVKKLARDFYFNLWAKNPPRCPAFNGEIVNITREGWEHITHDERKTKTDILGRLFVLERAKKLLEKTTIFSEKHTRDKKEYWVFDGVIDGVRLRVVVRSVEGKPKHFLTVIKKGSVEDEIGNKMDK